MSKYLNIPFIPAEKIFYFKNNEIDFNKIKLKLHFYLNKYPQIIIPGFYGVDEGNRIKLLSRGGGDVSGAIIAKILKPCVYENWTDVDGVKEVNPAILKSSTITKMNYNQLALMTKLDAKVIHPDCANILKGENVELQVRNIFNLNSLFTTVDDQSEWSNFVSYQVDGEVAKLYFYGGNEIADASILKGKVRQIYNRIK